MTDIESSKCVLLQPVSTKETIVSLLSDAGDTSPLLRKNMTLEFKPWAQTTDNDQIMECSRFHLVKGRDCTFVNLQVWYRHPVKAKKNWLLFSLDKDIMKMYLWFHPPHCLQVKADDGFIPFDFNVLCDAIQNLDTALNHNERKRNILFTNTLSVANNISIYLTLGTTATCTTPFVYGEGNDDFITNNNGNNNNNIAKFYGDMVYYTLTNVRGIHMPCDYRNIYKQRTSNLFCLVTKAVVREPFITTLSHTNQRTKNNNVHLTYDFSTPKPNTVIKYIFIYLRSDKSLFDALALKDSPKYIDFVVGTKKLELNALDLVSKTPYLCPAIKSGIGNFLMIEASHYYAETLPITLENRNPMHLSFDIPQELKNDLVVVAVICSLFDAPTKDIFYSSTTRGNNNNGADGVCAICLEEFAIQSSTQQLVRQPQCQHIFHKKCFDQWLLCSHTCPMCRADFF